MRKVIVQYKLKPGRAAENEALIKDVYKELSDKKIAGFQYMTLKLEDGLSYIHIGFSESEDVRKAFGNLTTFKNFLENIKDRCDVAPVQSQVSDIIGSYNF